MSKSISNFFHNNSLHLLESFAAQQNQIVAPFTVFTWRRIKRMKEKGYFHYKIGEQSYFILDAAELKDYESEKLNAYLKQLAWNKYTDFQ